MYGIGISEAKANYFRAVYVLFSKIQLGLPPPPSHWDDTLGGEEKVEKAGWGKIDRENFLSPSEMKANENKGAFHTKTMLVRL